MPGRGRRLPGLFRVNPFSIARRVGESARRAIDDARRQAPGARMVGEFTVRQTIREIRRRLGGPR